MNLQGFRENEDDEVGVMRLSFEYPIGATGAVGTKTRGRGILSFARTNTGLYTITLTEGVIAILDVDLKVQPASYAAAEGNDVRTLTRTPATGVITIEVTAPADGTAADPDDGSIIFGTIKVKTSNG